MGFYEGYRDSVTDQYAVKPTDFMVGEVRVERDITGIKKYVFMQADDAVTAGQFVKFDMGITTPHLVAPKATPTTAVADVCLGLPAGGLAVPDEYYFWCQFAGVAIGGNVKTGVAAGDPLVCSATAGALQKQTNTTTAPESVCAVAMEANSSGSDAQKAVRLLGVGLIGD